MVQAHVVREYSECIPDREKQQAGDEQDLICIIRIS